MACGIWEPEGTSSGSRDIQLIDRHVSELVAQILRGWKADEVKHVIDSTEFHLRGLVLPAPQTSSLLAE